MVVAILFNTDIAAQGNNEGVYMLTHIGNKEDSLIFSPFSAHPTYQKIWYNDSIFIYKNNGYYSDDNTEGFELRTINYVFHNINSHLYQVYYNFSDTARPFCTYRSLDNRRLHMFMQLYLIQDTVEAQIKDTLINGKINKIIRKHHPFILRDTTWYIISDYFMEKKGQGESIGSVERVDSLHLLFPDFVLRKSSHYTQYFKSFVIKEGKVIRPYLTEREKKIMAKWTENSRKVGDLPLIDPSTMPCRLGHKENPNMHDVPD